LPVVIQAVKPWISAKDIDKGSRWRDEIAQQLDESNAGIVCVTKNNQHARWLLFEAGAISKSVDESLLWTYLLDLNPADVEEPLAQFQHTIAERDDTKKLVQSINKALNERPLPDEVLEDAFNTYWPRLEEKLEAIPEDVEKSEPKREDSDKIDEILGLVRGLSRDQPINRLTESLGANLYRNALVDVLSGEEGINVLAGGISGIEKAAGRLGRDALVRRSRSRLRPGGVLGASSTEQPESEDDDTG